MRAFDERWRRLARVAREAEPPLPPPPLHRVRDWLRAGTGRRSTAGVGSTDLWFRYGLRGLATATAVLLASVWFAMAGMARDHDPGPLQPGLEQAVAEAFWLL